MIYQDAYEPIVSAEQINLKASFHSASKRSDKGQTAKKKAADTRKLYTVKK